MLWPIVLVVVFTTIMAVLWRSHRFERNGDWHFADRYRMKRRVKGKVGVSRAGTRGSRRMECPVDVVKARGSELKSVAEKICDGGCTPGDSSEHQIKPVGGPCSGKSGSRNHDGTDPVAHLSGIPNAHIARISNCETTGRHFGRRAAF